ncbi:plasmid partitioning protein RepB C-terminal domain-containing protein, partial [Mesorhizobium sp. M4B.F.Ca.ET.049.02.1.2]
SYIERALFAARLEDRSFSREVIMAALNIDKAALSKMLSVVRAIPIELIEAIGSAPEVGRRRWMEFAEKLQKAKVETQAVLAALSADNSSDQRFQQAAGALTSIPKMTREEPRTNLWGAKDKSVSVNVKATANKAIVTYEAKDGPSFAAYITARLDDLYEAFRKSQKPAIGD